MAATLEIHFLTLKYTHCQFCQNYPKKVAKIKLILAKLAFATNYEVWVSTMFYTLKVLTMFYALEVFGCWMFYTWEVKIPNLLNHSKNKLKN